MESLIIVSSSRAQWETLPFYLLGVQFCALGHPPSVAVAETKKPMIVGEKEASDLV